MIATLETTMFSFHSSSKTTMVDQSEALPGRDRPLQIDEEHAVLGTPLEGPWPEGHEVISFAMGCFWGAERIFWQIPGVHTTAAGYQGGYTPHPTYREVCTARTGHAEAVLVVYDPQIVSIETLLKAFWENHDPTTPNQQGNDIGTQYRSAIYPTTAEQLEAALASRDHYQARLGEAGYGRITTEIRPASEAGEFYYAENEHQAYLHKNPYGYCNHGFCQVSYAGPDEEDATARVRLPGA